MATENEALATQETEETSVQENQEESQSTDSQEPDWKAKFEESEVGRLKIANDLKAEQGRRTRDQMVQEIADEQGTLRQMVTALLTRTASGDTEALTEDIANISQTTAQTRATRAWDANYSEAEAGLGEVVLNDDGDVILSKDDIATLTPLWQKAQTGRDLAGLYRVINQANKMVRVAEKTAAETALKTQAEEAVASKKASDAKHGIHDMSTGSGAAGGSVGSWAAAQKIKSIQDISDKDYESLVAG